MKARLVRRTCALAFLACSLASQASVVLRHDLSSYLGAWSSPRDRVPYPASIDIGSTFLATVSEVDRGHASNKPARDAQPGSFKQDGDGAGDADSFSPASPALKAASMPEPGTVALLGLALICLAVSLRRK